MSDDKKYDVQFGDEKIMLEGPPSFDPMYADGAIHFNNNPSDDGARSFALEFELIGKQGTRQGCARGRNPMAALRSFLECYPTSGEYGIIHTIRVVQDDARTNPQAH